MGLRKNQNKLSAVEKARFVAAVKEMKRAGDYDVFVQWHLDAGNMITDSINVAHMGPAFLPWHRQFLILFEEDLVLADQRLGNDGQISLPYWDWTYDQSKVPNNQRGAIWDKKFMGPSGRKSDGRVEEGPFASDNPPGNWILNVRDPSRPTINYLERDFGGDPDAGSLPAKQQVEDALAITTYDQDPWNRSPSLTNSFRNVLEGWTSNRDQPELHNRVHVWVGGSMLPMSSPNDPIFFLHHCNVDRIWALWQYQNAQANQFPPHGEAANGHNFDDIMFPWTGGPDPRPSHSGSNLPVIQVKDVLNHQASSVSYDTDPVSIGTGP